MNLIMLLLKGPDNFSYLLLKNLPEIFILVFLDLFNLIFGSKGICLSTMKTAEVFALPKAGKDQADPLKYRQSDIRLSERFRRNHSTINHLVRLQTEINTAFRKFLAFLLISRKPMTWSGGRGCYIKFTIWE